MATRTAAAKLLHDVAIRYQIYLERLKTGEAQKVNPIIRSLDRAIQSVLSRAGGDAPTVRQLNLMLAQLRKEGQAILDGYQQTQMASLKKLSSYATDFTVDKLGLVWPSAAPAIVAPMYAEVWASTLAAPVQATGQLLEPFVASWGSKALVRVEGAIRTGYAQGKTTDQIVRTIRGTKSANFQDGLLGGQTKREATAVVRTAIQHTSSSAQMSTYQANDDLVEGYQWLSTLDSRTTSQCRSLDGRIFKLGEGPVPPIHINCRSTTIPKLKGLDLLSTSTRASKGAEGGQQVPASETYYEWLKRQPADFQVDALGKERAQLFRNGGLSADDFARLNLDKNFQPLTLEQMRQKNPAAFALAGLTP